jgi:1-acyl-sn-glycerol-3-phosphate acyltransferase
VLLKGFDQLVQRGLRGVWVRGALPPGGFVWAAPHQSWWDPFVAAVVLTGEGRTPSLVMDQDNLGDFAFLRRVGVFGTAELRQGLDHLRAGHALIVFPERDLVPAGPLRELADGAAWLALQAGVPLVAAAVRVAARGHQASEAYVDLADVPLPAGRARADVSTATAELARVLGGRLAEVDAAIATADPRQPLPGFTEVVHGKRSMDERLQRWAARFGR